MPATPKPPRGLYRRGDVWYARFSIGGVLHRECLSTADIREAKERYKALRKAAERQKFGIEEAPGWEEAVLSYCTGVLDRGNLKPSSAVRYTISLRQIGPFFDGLKLHQIDNEKIGDFVEERQLQGVKNTTIKRDLSAMSRVLAFAVHKRKLPRNPVDDYDLSFISDKKTAICPPEDDVIAVAVAAAAVTDPELAVLLRFLRATGMRTGEALRATWADVKGGQVTIRKTKNGYPRTIRMPVVAGLVPGTGRLFPTMPETSGALSTVWLKFRKRHEAIPYFRLHDLRHAYAVGEIRNWCDIYDLSRHLGHSSVKVTEGYLHARPERDSRPRPGPQPEVAAARAVNANGPETPHERSSDTGGDTSGVLVTQECVSSVVISLDRWRKL